MTRRLPNQDFLRECFSYNRRSGEMIWRERPLKHFVDKRACRSWNTRYAGRPAGRIATYIDSNTKYVVVGLGSREYPVHRIIWKLVSGDDPTAEIDHKDQNGLNNRWRNLREATRSQNATNMGGLRPNNTSGYKGIYWHARERRWEAKIRAHGKRIYLGSFITKEKAYEAYVAAAKHFHGEYANLQ